MIWIDWRQYRLIKALLLYNLPVPSFLTDYEKTEDWSSGGTQKGNHICIFFKIYFPPISNTNNFKVHYVMVCSFICKSVWHSMYAKFLIYLWWNSVWAYMKYYFYRTKEMSIFWRGEMFPMRTSVRTLMLTEISDRYVCFFLVSHSSLLSLGSQVNIFLVFVRFFFVCLFVL